MARFKDSIIEPNYFSLIQIPETAARQKILLARLKFCIDSECVLFVKDKRPNTAYYKNLLIPTYNILLTLLRHDNAINTKPIPLK